MNNRIAFIFLGLTGGGKGTSRDLLKERILQEKQSTPFISDTGDHFRKSLKHDPDSIITLNSWNESRLKEINDSGQLQCSALATAMWGPHFLQRYNGEQYLLIDGSPRRIEEALVLEQFLQEYLDCSAVEYYYIHVDLAVAIERMKARHLIAPRPETSSEERIKTRLNDFFDKTEPVMKHLKDLRYESFHPIDNNGSLETLKEQLYRIPL